MMLFVAILVPFHRVPKPFCEYGLGRVKKERWLDVIGAQRAPGCRNEIAA